MQTRVMSLLVAVVLLFASMPGAVAATNTYTGRASVASQSAGELADGLRRALAMAVARLTGDREVLARPDVAAALGQAPQFALQYHYEPADEGFTLVAFFDRHAVDNMLAELGGLTTLDREPPSGPPSEAVVLVTGIHSAIDYARMIGYLEGLDLVRSAQPEQVHDDRVAIRLQLAVDLHGFLAMLESGRTLLVQTSTAESGADAILAYQR